MTPPSQRLIHDEIRELLASKGEEGREVLAAMFPPSTDTARLYAQVTRERAPVARAPLPFVPRPAIDENQLADFNDRFSSKLAAPVSVDAARAIDFQTNEDWNGYVTSGAAAFVLGKAVERPLELDLPDPANAMTFPLRPGEDPASKALRLGLFADFGNGLYASREVARRVIEGRYPYAFHLGDVYYDGNEEEFRRYFEEPLAPLLAQTELFMLSGNHEMYSKGANFQRYLRRKAAQHPALQRQNAELFRLRGHGVQIIGLDTMWCHWEGKLFRGNEPRLDAPRRALLERWLAEGDPDGLNILLTSNEPFSIESNKTTKMLEDLRPYVERGLIDLWFWGNVHHAAIFDGWKVPGSPEHGFLGACVGHGGYPFYTQREADVPKGVSCRWWESKHRFWPYDGLRSDVGLNGLAELSIARTTGGWEVDLTYRDWVGRDRARAKIRKPRGMGPQLLSVAENLSPSRDGADWQLRPDPGARAVARAPRALVVRGAAGAPAEGTRAVAEAEALWKKGIRESVPASTAEIAVDSGWNVYGDLRDDAGKVTHWCGMFVATALFRAALTKKLRAGFWHTTNVERFFTYRYEARVPRWVWDDAGRAWRTLRELHLERGAPRTWTGRKALAQADLATLDAAPGDVLLVDHEGDGAPDHIALVERYDPTTGRLHTLEGNARGRVALGVGPDGAPLEGQATGDAVVRVTRDLNDPNVRRTIYGLGRLSALDFAGLSYKAQRSRPAGPPSAQRVLAARAPAVNGEPRAAGEHVARDIPRGKWDLPPEPVPVWLDPKREVTEETAARPAPRAPFVVAAMKACLALGCDAKQAAGIVANSINETGWGRSYRAFNCGGWKITERYVRDFKRAHPGQAPAWWRAPGNRGSGDPPWCYYRAFPSFEAYFAEWILHFVPRVTDPKPYPRYRRSGELFWGGEDWFPALVAAGYKGPVTKANPARAIREHDALVLTALRMWAQAAIGVEVDGVWGPASRAALRAWQSARGLSPSGQLDDATLDALAGRAGGERGGLDRATAPVDAGRAAWALDEVRAGATAPRAPRATADALDTAEALLRALKEATPARRRRLAAKVARLLAREAAR